MKPHLIIACLALVSCLPSTGQTPDSVAAKPKNIRIRLGNGSVVTGSILYITPDGKILEMQTPQGTRPVWFDNITAVRRDKENRKWRKRPNPWTFRQRYDRTWKDPCRWEFGFYGDYGFGVGANGLNRFEAGANLRYGLSQYLFVGGGVGINGIQDLGASRNSVFTKRINTTGCAVFANARGYFRNRGVRPFSDLWIGYNFPTSSYTVSQSRSFSDKGIMLRLSAGIAVVDRSDIAYSLAVAYQMHSVKLTELNKKSFRHMSGSVGIEMAVTFRW